MKQNQFKISPSLSESTFVYDIDSSSDIAHSVDSMYQFSNSLRKLIRGKLVKFFFSTLLAWDAHYVSSFTPRTAVMNFIRRLAHNTKPTVSMPGCDPGLQLVLDINKYATR